jgi:hypothetical protein
VRALPFQLLCLAIVLQPAMGARAEALPGYHALFRCFQALESEELTFRDPTARFGKLASGVFFLRTPDRAGEIGGTVTLFHAGGLSAFRVEPRSSPVRLVGRLDGEPAFWVLFRREGQADDTLVVEYAPARGRVSGSQLCGSGSGGRGRIAVRARAAR